VVCSIPSISKSGVDLVNGSRVLASSKQVASSVGLERGRDLHVQISTFLYYRLISQSDWRKPSLPS